MECTYSDRELARANAFGSIWSDELDDVFADVADYYDTANNYASLGLLNPLRARFISMIELEPEAKVLDVCAGTNVIGIELLKKEPSLEVHAVDRSIAMQDVGTTLAQRHGFHIESHICDVHRLPFPDDQFDVVTLQWATRHLRVIEVFTEIRRVLKPGGRFYHCDMSRPANRIVEQLYYLYLRGCLSLTAWVFGSGPASLNCRRYFIDAIRLFYSAEELSEVLSELGYTDVVGIPVLAGTVAFHRARKV